MARKPAFSIFIILILSLSIFLQAQTEDSRFEIFLRDGTNKGVTGASVYIVHMSTGDSLLVSPVVGKTGLYRRNNTAFGKYKVYVNGVLNTSDRFFATNRIYDFIVNVDPDGNHQIDTGGIADSAITSAKLAADVTVGVADGSITTEKLAGNAVTAPKLAPLAVGDYHLQDGAVTILKLDDFVITENKIVMNAVTTPKIADGAITQDKIAAEAVGETQLEFGGVNSFALSPNAVTTAKIADGAVTQSKLAPGVGGGILVVSVPSVSSNLDSVQVSIAGNGFVNPPEVVVKNKSGWNCYILSATNSTVWVRIPLVGFGDTASFDLILYSND